MNYIHFFAALLVSGTALAQPTAVDTRTLPAPTDSAQLRRPAFGLTGGGSYASYLGSDATNFSVQYRAGFAGGLTADLPLSGILTLHPEVLYTRKGAEFPLASRSRTLSYLDVPVLFRYHTGLSWQTTTAFFEAGPQGSLLLQAEDNDGNDAKGEFQKAGLDFIFGAGLRLRQGLTVGLRYDVGITNAYKQIPAGQSFGRGDYQPNYRNDVFMLLLGYSLGGK